MWATFSRTELNEAKRLLKHRREEMLRRHADELSVLEGELAQIQKLDELIEVFFSKSKDETALSSKISLVKDEDESGQEAQPVSDNSSFITETQKSRLRELGIDEERIRNMKPDEADRTILRFWRRAHTAIQSPDSVAAAGG